MKQEKNLTESEIMKALLCHFDEDKNCEDCPYVDRDEYCHILLGRDLKSILDLINRKNAEIAEKDADLERLRDLTRIWIPARSGGKTRFIVKKYNEVRSEAVNEFSERVSLYWLQFVIDEIRKFATKAGLDPVSSFNPTEKELNEKYKVVLEWLDHIKKEMGVEL